MEDATNSDRSVLRLNSWQNQYENEAWTPHAGVIYRSDKNDDRTGLNVF